MSIKAIVTDIEGTTSSIAFVHDVLFPYAREHMGSFIRAHRNDEVVSALVADVCAEVGRSLGEEEVIAQLVRWIDEDKKITPLKALQGLIWQAGYRSGDFTGHVYPDAYENLKKWQQQGMMLYVYSSGSVKAQQLLFGYSDFGDMTPLFSGYFDTRIGAKRETRAYQKIAEAIALPAAEILFLSDLTEELDAARRAGMRTIQLVRDGALSSKAPHPQVTRFDEIPL